MKALLATLCIRRLVCLSSLGVGESRANLNFFRKHIMFGLLLRPACVDHGEQERHIRASDLDWTIVRPGACTDGERTGLYRHGVPATAADLELKISRADVTDFMLDQLGNDAYLHRAPGISHWQRSRGGGIRPLPCAPFDLLQIRYKRISGSFYHGYRPRPAWLTFYMFDIA